MSCIFDCYSIPQHVSAVYFGHHQEGILVQKN